MMVMKRKLSRPAKTAGKAMRFYLAALAVLLLSFCAAFYLGFPTEALKNRLEAEIAANTPAQAEIGRLALAFPPALRAQDVTVETGESRFPRLHINSLRISPLWGSLLGESPGLSTRAVLLGGSASGDLFGDGQSDIQMQGLALSVPLNPNGPLNVSAVVRSGRFMGDRTMKARSTSSLDLTLERVQLTGLSALGLEADSLSLGTLSLRATGKGRALRIDPLTAEGGQFEGRATGTLLVGNRPEQSRINLSINLSPTPAADPKLVEMLALFLKPDAKGTFKLKLTGTLARPNMR